MSLAPGGRMRQRIYDSPYDINDFDLEHSSRCFIHLLNSEDWRAVTGEAPPHKPLRPRDYANAGLAWFDYYAADLNGVEGAEDLQQLKSVGQMAAEKDEALSDNESIDPEDVVELGPSGVRRVREGKWS